MPGDRDRDRYREREIAVLEREQALRERQFAADERKVPFSSAAVIVTMIVGLAGVGYKGLDALAKAKEVEAAKVRVASDRNNKGLELFVTTQDKVDVRPERDRGGDRHVSKPLS